MRGAAGRGQRAGRRALLTVALVGGLVPLTGCATKRDVRTLQQDLAALQVRQDSTLRVIQRQNDRLLDSLRAAILITQDASGQTSHRFQQLEQTLAQTQALVGQVVQVSRELMARLESAPQAQPAPGPTGISSDGTAEEYYQLGLEKMGDRAYTAARTAFQQLVSEFPEDTRAPDAQFQIGELYYLDEDYDRAVRELEKVAEQWPTAERAPAALYRAGVIAQERRENGKARELFNRVVNQYSGSSEAGLARTKLRSLPRP